MFCSHLPAWGGGRGGGGRCEPSECMVFSSCCGQKAIFSKMVTYKRAYFGVKITIMRARLRPQSCYFAFSHRGKFKWVSQFSALSKTLLKTNFCMPLGPTETQLMSCALARNNVLIRIYGVAEVHRQRRKSTTDEHFKVFRQK